MKTGVHTIIISHSDNHLKYYSTYICMMVFPLLNKFLLFRFSLWSVWSIGCGTCMLNMQNCSIAVTISIHSLIKTQDLFISEENELKPQSCVGRVRRNKLQYFYTLFKAWKNSNIASL